MKLGAEVSDMSEEMRLALKNGTAEIIARIARVAKEGRSDGSIPINASPKATAHALYELWVGASVMSKISHDRRAFDTALAVTDRILSGEAF